MIGNLIRSGRRRWEPDDLKKQKIGKTPNPKTVDAGQYETFAHMLAKEDKEYGATKRKSELKENLLLALGVFAIAAYPTLLFTIGKVVNNQDQRTPTKYELFKNAIPETEESSPVISSETKASYLSRTGRIEGNYLFVPYKICQQKSWLLFNSKKLPKNLEAIVDYRESIEHHSHISSHGAVYEEKNLCQEGTLVVKRN